MIKNNFTRQFLAFLDLEVSSLNRKNKFGLAENYESSSRSFRTYLATLHKEDIALKNIDDRLIADYQQWLLDRGVKKNSVVFYLRNLRTCYNKAVKRGLVKDRKPFADIKTNITHTEKRAIKTDIIRRIDALDITNGLIKLGYDPSKKSFVRMCRDLAFARDTFIFCFCARGLTFVDFAYLKWENIMHGRIVYYRRKTGQCIELKIQGKMHNFIATYSKDNSPYLFPVLSSTNVEQAHKQYATALRRYNQQLHTISKMLDGEINLTSYVSRHSWATAAYHAEIPLSYISEAMGHTSEQTTRIYLQSLEGSRIDNANQLLLDSIFK